MGQSVAIMGLRWLVLLGLLCLTYADESGDGEGASGEEDAGSGEGDEAAEGVANEASGDGDADGGASGDAGGEGDEECEVEETEGSGSGDDIGDILALGGENKKCKKKGEALKMTKILPGVRTAMRRIKKRGKVQ